MTDTPNPSRSATGITEDRLLAGRYRLVRRIASGGMAEVWEATDEVLARQVAVKLLHRRLADDESFVERFRREAVSAARLSHPSIVSIFDTVSDDDTEAIVMELVRGSTLRERLDRDGTLPAALAVDIVAQAAEALEFAHRAGVVHRDVKPGNILLCDDRRVLVADFGIAKAASESTDLTSTGSVVGTAKYLAPEQVEGRPVDGRADVYALGVVLYEILCGRPPFEADTELATAVMRLNRDPASPRQVRAGIPRRLEQVVMKAMARDADKRYASAGDFRAALLSVDVSGDDDATGALMTSDATSVVPAAPAGKAPSFTQSERRWLVPALIVCLVAVGLGVAGVLLGSTGVGQDLLDRVGEGVGVKDPEPAVEPVQLAGSTSFDPEGDGEENESEAAFATDGNPATAWRTDRYNSRVLPPFKAGVGLVVRVASAAELRELKVLTTNSEGWAAEVFVADGQPADLGGWGEAVDRKEGLGTEASFDLKGRNGTAVLIWLTDVGESNRAEITEVTVSA